MKIITNGFAIRSIWSYVPLASSLCIKCMLLLFFCKQASDGLYQLKLRGDKDDIINEMMMVKCPKFIRAYLSAPCWLGNLSTFYSFYCPICQAFIDCFCLIISQDLPTFVALHIIGHIPFFILFFIITLSWANFFSNHNYFFRPTMSRVHFLIYLIALWYIKYIKILVTSLLVIQTSWIIWNSSVKNLI